jgi:hypothetical protein
MKGETADHSIGAVYGEVGCEELGHQIREIDLARFMDRPTLIRSIFIYFYTVYTDIL